MQAIYGVTSGENIVQAFTEENTTEANFHQSINNAAILTFTTTEPLKDGVRFFLTKDPINDYKNEEFMYFEITDQDFDGYEYTYRAEEYAYHDLDTMGYVKQVYLQGVWTTKSLLESIVYNDVEPKGIARTKWEVIDNDLTLPTTWAGEGNTYTLWYNTPLRGIEKFIEYFGGEIRFYVTIANNKISRHYLEIYEKRGRETGKRYESNSNLISLTNKAEYNNRYEYIIPLAEGGGASGDEQKYNTPNGFNNYITLEGLEVGKSTDKWYKPKSQLYVSLANDKNAYPLKSQPKGLQNNPRIKPVTFEDIKSKEALFDKAIEWLENNQGVAWSYYASVLDIGESQVGDTIAIIDERSGISSYVRVHDIDYDMIDPENTGVHFGSNWGYENDEAITDMVNTATSAKNNLTGLIDTAIRQSNGKNSNYYGTNEPADPIEGDLWYWQKGDESGIKIYQNGNWIDLVDSNTVKRINEQVDKALLEANSYADSLNAKQASEAAAFQSEANAALSSAANDRERISEVATSMANSAMGRANEVADKADKIDGKVVAVGKSVEGLTAVVNDPETGLSAVADIASDGVTIATTAKNTATTAIQTAKGVQTTVESMGQVNHLNNTEFTPDFQSWGESKDGLVSDDVDKYVSVSGTYDGSNAILIDNTAETNRYYSIHRQLVPIAGVSNISISWAVKTIAVANYSNLWIRFFDNTQTKISETSPTSWAGKVGDDWSTKSIENIQVPSDAAFVMISFEAREGTQQYLSKPMLVFESTVGTYTQGNYNNNAILKSIHTQLAGQITDEIEDRKNGDKSVVTQTKELIDQRVKSVEDGYESAISQSADNIMASVSMPNKLFNTDFSPDLEGWDIYKPDKGNVYQSYIYKASNAVGFDTRNATDGHYGVIEQFVTPPNTIDSNAVISMRWTVRTAERGDTTFLFIAFLDKNGNEISEQHINWGADKVGGNKEEHKFENIAIPKGTNNIKVSFQVAKGNRQYLWKPMLVFNSSAPLSYMSGSYSSMNAATVFTLTNNSFGLNIMGHTGDIITGINGDSSGLVIAGKKIVVNGDTIFDGNNFMNAAVIADGTIGTAKIGDLAVTSAKIKDINVDKIVGNVSSFIKSKWDGKYESVTIDSTGMMINVPEEQSFTKYSGDGIQIAKWNGSTAYMAASQWKDSTDEGLQIGIGDDSEYFSLGYQNRKDKVYYAKLLWGSPKAKTVDKGFNFYDKVGVWENLTLFADLDLRIGDVIVYDTKFKNPNAGQPLTMSSTTFDEKGFSYPTFGNMEGKTNAGFAYGTTNTYLLSGGSYYNATAVIKAFNKAGTLQIPTRMNSDGTVAQWVTIKI